MIYFKIYLKESLIIVLNFQIKRQNESGIRRSSRKATIERRVWALPKKEKKIGISSCTKDNKRNISIINSVSSTESLNIQNSNEIINKKISISTEIDKTKVSNTDKIKENNVPSSSKKRKLIKTSSNLSANSNSHKLSSVDMIKCKRKLRQTKKLKADELKSDNDSLQGNQNDIDSKDKKVIDSSKNPPLIDKSQDCTKSNLENSDLNKFNKGSSKEGLKNKLTSVNCDKKDLVCIKSQVPNDQLISNSSSDDKCDSNILLKEKHSIINQSDNNKPSNILKDKSKCKADKISKVLDSKTNEVTSSSYCLKENDVNHNKQSDNIRSEIKSDNSSSVCVSPKNPTGHDKDNVHNRIEPKINETPIISQINQDNCDDDGEVSLSVALAQLIEPDCHNSDQTVTIHSASFASDIDNVNKKENTSKVKKLFTESVSPSSGLKKANVTDAKVEKILKPTQLNGEKDLLDKKQKTLIPGASTSNILLHRLLDHRTPSKNSPSYNSSPFQPSTGVRDVKTLQEKKISSPTHTPVIDLSPTRQTVVPPPIPHGNYFKFFYIFFIIQKRLKLHFYRECEKKYLGSEAYICTHLRLVYFFSI